MDPRPDLFADPTGLVGRLASWAASLRADEAATARARERFLVRTAEEDATFAGVLLDLAERGGPVVLSLSGGRRHRGVVGAVGRDFCLLLTDQGGQVVVAHRGIASVRPEGRSAGAPGGRPVAVSAGLAEALAIVAEDRPRALVVTAGDDGLAGELRGVGRDVLTLLLDGPDRPRAHVPIDNVVEVVVAG